MGNQQGKSVDASPVIEVEAPPPPPAFQIQIDNTAATARSEKPPAVEDAVIARVVLDDILTVDFLTDLHLEGVTSAEEFIDTTEHVAKSLWDAQVRYFRQAVDFWYPCSTGFIQSHCVARQPQPKLLLLIVDGAVYDATTIAPTHKAGAKIITRNANGKDCGATFRRIHGPRAHEQLRSIKLGPLVDMSPTCASAVDEESHLSAAAAGTSGATTHLNEEKEVSGFTVIATHSVTANTKCITFGSPTKLPLPPGGHVTITHGEVSRNYTPYDVRDTSFTIMVKHYSGGALSTYLHSIHAGQFVAVSPPLEPEVTIDDVIQATRDGERATRLTAAEATEVTPTLVMVAGGTGVAPLYSMLYALVAHGGSAPVHIVFFACFRDASDALLGHELADLAERSGGNSAVRVDLYFTFSRSDLGRYCNHVAFCGRFCDSQLAQTVQRVDAAIVCGPPGFGDSVRGVICGVSFRPDARRVFLL